MDISSISEYYELKPLKVRPSQLLLDPKNPRIVLDVNTKRTFTQSELTSPDVQEYILSVINKQSHHIADLIRGIRASGFIDKGDDMIVKRIPHTDKYLVVEGNRRTTAIKHLLKDDESLKPVVRNTLASLHVKEFLYKPNNQFKEETIINILLGTIHVTGRLPWGALEKAYYIYDNYLRELRKHTRDPNFEYNISCCKEIAAFFNLTPNDVCKEIKIYRVYEQIKDEKYDVMPDHFSLIDMAVKDRALSKEYFELNPTTFQFSRRGLVRFDKLCVRENRPIHNPRDFRIFAKVFRDGTEFEVSQIESGEQNPATILDRIYRRQEHCQFLDQLSKVKEQIEALRPSDFRNLSAEVLMIREIKKLVDELGRLGRT